MKNKMILTAVILSGALCACGTENAPPATADIPEQETVTAAVEETTGEADEISAQKEEASPEKTKEAAPDPAPAADDTYEDDTYEKEEIKMKDPVLLYMGHASLRIVTGDDKVIYIDPFAGDAYDLSADLVLQTHDHFDHKDMSKIKNRNEDCVIITQDEALKDGEHHSFDLSYVKVEAVEAGYNKNHDKNSCTGYILTFENNVSLYISGDTSKTDQMEELGKRGLDYAFFCCDGIFNMDVSEASGCAGLVGAKVSIPYHTASAAVTIFDEANAARFSVPGAMILKPGEELSLTKQDN